MKNKTKRNQFFKQNKGFSLAEIVVAAGLLGILSLSLMNITKEQAVQEKRASTGFEITSLANSINTILLNSDACVNTLSPLGNIKNAESISIIKNRSDQDQFTVGDTYGNNLVKITDISIENTIVTPASIPINSIGVGSLDIKIQFTKLSKLIKGNTIITKTIPVRTSVDSNFIVTKCYSATENAVETAKTDSCSGLGGSYDEATQKCVLPSTSTDTAAAVSFSAMETYVNSSTGDFVLTTGDTMTGGLDIDAGNLYVKNGYIQTDLYFTSSDESLKHNINTIGNKDKDRLFQLRGVDFIWNKTEKRDYGFIAQEVESIYPDLVMTNKETGLKAVKYINIVPLLLEVTKDLKIENHKIKEQFKQQQKQIESLLSLRDDLCKIDNRLSYCLKKSK